MLVPLEISTRLIDLTPALESELRRRVGKLERLYDRINSCRIAVERPSLHHREGGPYRVRLDITVPGHELVVNKEAEDLNVAVRDAFQAAERQVEDFHDRRRHEVKVSEHPPQGQVVRLFPEEGYGFIQGSEGQELYFHRNSVLEPGFGQLKVGSSVRYAEEQGYEGPQASTVTPLST
jgi:ribosomal subunit interface protein